MIDDRIKSVLCARFPMLDGSNWKALGGGRTNRVWRVGGWVVKAAIESCTNLLFPNDPRAEIKALACLGGNFAPLFLGATEIEGCHYIIYEFCEGESVGPAAPELAKTLSKVHQIPPWPGLRKIASGARDVIAMGERLFAIAGEGAPPAPSSLEVAPLARAALLHGDPVPANAIECAGRAVLIDWQCPASGDPAADIAIALSPAMNALYAEKTVSLQAEECFLKCYAETSEGAALVAARYQQLKPFFHYRMWAYCAFQNARGVEGYGQGAALEEGALAQSQS